MKNTLTRSLLGSTVVLLLLVAFALVLRFYKTVVPEQVERDTINITRSDYEQAKAKWEAQKIGVYEATSSDPRVTARLRVDRGTGDLFLLELTVERRPETLFDTNQALTDVRAKVYGQFTVDALFDSVQSALDTVAGGGPAPDSSGTTNFSDYNVQFDPSRGYPVHFTQDVRTTLSSREITWRSTVDTREVTNFTAVR